MKQRSRWNPARGHRPDGEAGLVALRGELEWSPGGGLLVHISAATSGGGAAWRGVGPAGSRRGKRTHLLYEIISNQIQHRTSPV